MHILILSWRGPGHPHAGGAEKVIYKHASYWIKKGHTVTLFTSDYEGAKKDELLHGIHIVRRGNQTGGVHIQALQWYLFGKHEKIDIVIDEFHGIPFFTPLYMAIPKIAFIHEVAKEVWKYNPWPRPFNLIPYFFGTIFEPLIFIIIYKHITFITVSNSTRSDLETWKIPSKNISVIHNGLTITLPSKIKGKGKGNIIMYLGALAKDKGIEDAIACFIRLARQPGEWKFYIVGKGEDSYTRYLKDLVNKGNITQITEFPGFVDEAKKIALLMQSHVLINPSIREGWGLTVLEAAAVGTPTIGYNVAGLRDSIMHGKTGLLTTQNTPEEMARCVIEFLMDKNKAQYQQFRMNAIKYAQQFSWDTAGEKSLSLITSMKK